MRSTNRGATRLDIAVVLLLLAVLLAFAIPTRALCDEKGDRAKCAKNLGAIAKAANQYASDWGSYPHIGKPTELDNAGKTSPAGNDVPARCLRVLAWDGKVTDPETFVCPASSDKAAALSDEAKKDGRCFRWGGSGKEIGTSPIAKADEKDKDSDKLTDLSYGWTLKQITAKSAATTIISGDRARTRDKKDVAQKIKGNHPDGWQVVTVDSTVKWIKAADDAGKSLASTGAADPALVVWDETNSEKAAK